MQVKKLRDLTEEELQQRMDALGPLCNWPHSPRSTDKELFMQRLWCSLEIELFVRE